MNVIDDLYGFPCKIENPFLLEMARYPDEKIQDKEVEERRLFYVALTRAKEKVYIFTKEGMESKFLDQILFSGNSIKIRESQKLPDKLQVTKKDKNEKLARDSDNLRQAIIYFDGYISKLQDKNSEYFSKLFSKEKTKEMNVLSRKINLYFKNNRLKPFEKRQLIKEIEVIVKKRIEKINSYFGSPQPGTNYHPDWN